MIDLADSPSVDDFSHVYTAEPVLQLKDVHKSFGSLKVLDGLNIAVYPGEVFKLQHRLVDEHFDAGNGL